MSDYQNFSHIQETNSLFFFIDWFIIQIDFTTLAPNYFHIGINQAIKLAKTKLLEKTGA